MSYGRPDIPTFKCWDVLNQEEADACDIEAWDPDAAARTFGEQRHADADYPEEQVIAVLAADGTLTQWTVTAEPTVRFRARQKEDAT